MFAFGRDSIVTSSSSPVRSGSGPGCWRVSPARRPSCAALRSAAAGSAGGCRLELFQLSPELWWAPSSQCDGAPGSQPAVRRSCCCPSPLLWPDPEESTTHSSCLTAQCCIMQGVHVKWCVIQQQGFIVRMLESIQLFWSQNVQLFQEIPDLTFGVSNFLKYLTFYSNFMQI